MPYVFIPKHRAPTARAAAVATAVHAALAVALVTTLLFTLALAAAPAAVAVPAFMGASAADPRMLVAQVDDKADDKADDIGEARAADIAASTTGGRVLGVEWIETSPAAYYAVKVLLDDGVVKTIKVAAQSGDVMD